MRKLAILVILTLAVMISGCNKSASTEIPHKDEELKHKTELIRINEVLSKNENIILDKSNNYSDYIELYNYGEIDVDLSNYMLFDNNNLDDGWNFPLIYFTCRIIGFKLAYVLLSIFLAKKRGALA